jgi:hypothetical protein
MRREEPLDNDLFGNTRENTRVFVLSDTQEDLERLRKVLLAEFHETLDPIRTDLLRKSLSKWMPWDNEYHGLSSTYGVHQFARRVRFYRGHDQPHQPDQAVLGWSLSATQRGSMNGTAYVEEIPEYLKPHLQDWIEEARRLNDAPNPNAPAKP